MNKIIGQNKSRIEVLELGMASLNDNIKRLNKLTSNYEVQSEFNDKVEYEPRADLVKQKKGVFYSVISNNVYTRNDKDIVLDCDKTESENEYMPIKSLMTGHEYIQVASTGAKYYTTTLRNNCDVLTNLDNKNDIEIINHFIEHDIDEDSKFDFSSFGSLQELNIYTHKPETDVGFGDKTQTIVLPVNNDPTNAFDIEIQGDISLDKLGFTISENSNKFDGNLSVDISPMNGDVSLHKIGNLLTNLKEINNETNEYTVLMNQAQLFGLACGNTNNVCSDHAKPRQKRDGCTDDITHNLGTNDGELFNTTDNVFIDIVDPYIKDITINVNTNLVIPRFGNNCNTSLFDNNYELQKFDNHKNLAHLCRNGDYSFVNNGNEICSIQKHTVLDTDLAVDGNIDGVIIGQNAVINFGNVDASSKAICNINYPATIPSFGTNALTNFEISNYIADDNCEINIYNTINKLGLFGVTTCANLSESLTNSTNLVNDIKTNERENNLKEGLEIKSEYSEESKYNIDDDNLETLLSTNSKFNGKQHWCVTTKENTSKINIHGGLYYSLIDNNNNLYLGQPFEGLFTNGTNSDENIEIWKGDFVNYPLPFINIIDKPNHACVYYESDNGKTRYGNRGWQMYQTIIDIDKPYKLVANYLYENNDLKHMWISRLYNGIKCKYSNMKIHVFKHGQKYTNIPEKWKNLLFDDNNMPKTQNDSDYMIVTEVF